MEGFGHLHHNGGRWLHHCLLDQVLIVSTDSGALNVETTVQDLLSAETSFHCHGHVCGAHGYITAVDNENSSKQSISID